MGIESIRKFIFLILLICFFWAAYNTIEKLVNPSSGVSFDVTDEAEFPSITICLENDPFYPLTINDFDGLISLLDNMDVFVNIIKTTSKG